MQGQRWWVPWLYLAPALLILFAFLVYPTIHTIILSFMDENGEVLVTEHCKSDVCEWGIFHNYWYAFHNPSMQEAFVNNIRWLVFFTSITVFLGLVLAVLFDRVRYEPIVKSAIFLPMAISFVGAGVIWGAQAGVYKWTNPAKPQVGLLNAILVALVPGFEPKNWLRLQPWNNFALIVVGIWMWTGFAMVILSAAIKSIPKEILEAARVDGANEFQIFFRIIIPSISSTLTVVATTMVINVLKIFDIVYVMTGGRGGTDVIANRMYTEMFINFEDGRGSAIAVILLLLIVPVMIANIRSFREQEATR